MQRTFSITALLMAVALSTGCSEDTTEDATSDEPIPVVFQSKWFPQAQFAGYYIAGGIPADAAGVPRERSR